MKSNEFEVDKITYISHEGTTLYLAVESDVDEKMFMGALMDAGLYVHHRGDNNLYGVVLAYIDTVEMRADVDSIDDVIAKDGNIEYIFYTKFDKKEG